MANYYTNSILAYALIGDVHSKRSDGRMAGITTWDNGLYTSIYTSPPIHLEFAALYARDLRGRCGIEINHSVRSHIDVWPWLCCERDHICGG